MLAFPSALSLFSARPRSLFDDLLGDSFFGDFYNFPRINDFVQSSPGPSASCRVQEKGLELELEVPRFRQEDIKIESDDKTGRLVILGKREAQRGAQKGTFHLAGSSIPSFRRVFTIDPHVYDLKQISTHLEDGVLHLLIPYAERKPMIEQQAQGQGGALKETVTGRPSVGSSDTVIPVTRESSTTKTTTEPPSTTSLMETKKPDEVARQGEEQQQQQQQLVNVFRWPPQMEITPKSESGPLTYTISLPAEMSNPDVSLHVLQPGYLCVDVAHTSKSENPFGFNEQRLSFSRTIPLPEGTTKENVNASIKEDGKLVITVQEGK